jgi:hypothetical protein
MIHGAEASLPHVMRMVEEQALVSITGKRIPVHPQCICVHGDNAEAVATAHAQPGCWAAHAITCPGSVLASRWPRVVSGALAREPGASNARTGNTGHCRSRYGLRQTNGLSSIGRYILV